MKPSSTVSWIVTLPNNYQADLKFDNVTQPKCNDRHTAIKVKLLGQEEEIMSRREDQPTEDLLIPQSFYLNMSNCIPEEGQFKAVTKIVLQKKPGKYLLIICLHLRQPTQCIRPYCAAFSRESERDLFHFGRSFKQERMKWNEMRRI